MDKISALMDGEIEPAEGNVNTAAGERRRARQCWQTYHLIRDGIARRTGSEPEFSARLHARLEQEPTFLRRAA